MKARVALKYCGGCDPGYDRVEYFYRIRLAAADSIEWVTLDDGDCESVLILNGCATACPEKENDFSRCARVVSVTDGEAAPAEIVKKLLE